MSTAAIPMGIGAESPLRKRPVSKKRYEPLQDIEIRFFSVAIVALIYLQIVVNQNISAGMKGVFLILATVILITFFWDTLEKVAQKWWHRSFIGFNTLYFLDPVDKSLKERIVPRWRVLSTELPSNVLAISIPLGGLLNFPRVVSEYKEVSELWQIRKREDIQTSIQYVQLLDQFEDGVSLPVDQALLFLESKQESLEFFPNWMNVFQDMRELISTLGAKLEAHTNECREEYINALKEEIAGFQAERTELREAQKKLFGAIHRSIRTLSAAQPSVASAHITTLIELLIRELIARVPEDVHQEETYQENTSNHHESEAA